MDYSSLDKEFKRALYFVPHSKIETLFKVSLCFLLLLVAVLPFSLLKFKTENFLARIEYPEKIKTEEENLSSLLKDKEEKTNFLLIGIPGEPWPAPYLTDSIEIVSINEKKKEILVIGIPRDFLVKIPNSNYETRINSLYSFEKSPRLLEEAVKEITGIKAHYFLVLDLSTIEKVVDILGGIDVEVKEDIFDPRFPTLNRGYETFSISKGHRHLDGRTTIKYIRSRHQIDGDFGRIKRQQQVMEAIREKALKLNILSETSKIFSIFNKVKENTNLGLRELKGLIKIAQDIPNAKVEYFLLNAGKKDSLLSYQTTILGKNLASVLWPRKGKFDYSEIKGKIKSLLEN